MAYEQEEFYYSVSTPLGKDRLLLQSFTGDEGISELFRFSLELKSEDTGIDFGKIVGKGATITVELTDGTERYIHGIIGRFLQAGTGPRFVSYYAELVPWLWLLTMSVDCKIFQNLSVPDIIEAVFRDHGQTDFKNDLARSYKPREYCVQYDESAFDFVSRLMEEEGIFYFFEHDKGKHTLVLADDPAAFKPCEGGDELSYGSGGVWKQQNVVTDCRLEESVIPGIHATDDFNFETPSTDLMASVNSSTEKNAAKRRIYEYPGGFAKKADGDRLAKLRVEEQDVPKKTLRGNSYCRAFVSGSTFALKDHYRSDVNAAYALRRVSHSASVDGYENAFEALPAKAPVRPPRTSRRPTISGSQTAVVVGKKGEEIWTDKYGRVKVQFHWDQVGKNDEHSSCWIRVAQGWAGKSWGQFFLPRIGQEVVVSFEEGNPDRPLITGAVYNAEQTVPYPLPGEQTKSTLKTNSSKGGRGYNELRFEDKKGSEEVYFQAERDFNRIVKQGNDKLDIKKGDREITVDAGDDTLTIKKGDRTTKINLGQSMTQATKAIVLKVGGSSVKIDQKGITIKGMMVSVAGQAKTELKGPMVQVKADAIMTLKGGLVKIN